MRKLNFIGLVVLVKSKGAAYLVGAEPGDAGLLTLRGAELPAGT